MSDLNLAAQAAESCEDARGALPSCAPLANPYVPFQNNAPERYTAGRALAKGTLFPGLDLPYRGVANVEPRAMALMQELQAVNFAITELGLYLDTHPDDKEALSLFIAYSDLYEAGKAEYQRRYGPLEQAVAGRGGFYDWLDDPWPWDASGKAEG